MKTIFVDGRVFTGVLPLKEAFAVEDGIFLAAGTNKEMLALAGPGDEVAALQGRFVCPGFNDSHMHLLGLGKLMEQCDLSQATASLADVQQALRAFAETHPEGWILARGFNQDVFSPATGTPTRHDLDAVCADRPICIVRCCGHALTVNTKALEIIGADVDTPMPEGGSAEIGPDGKLNGIFLDTAMELVWPHVPAYTRNDLPRLIRNAMKALNAVGVTSVQTDDFTTLAGITWEDVVAAYRALEDAGEMTVRVYEQSQFNTPAELTPFLDAGYKTGWGTPLFRIGPLKMVADGSLGARTAYMSTHYADAPDEKGLAIFTHEQLTEMLTLAHERGMQSAVHAIGDGILDDILAAYEHAFTVHPRDDHRSGIVHIQLTRPDQLEKVRELALHAYAQSVFIDYDSRIVEARAGKELASTSYAFRTLRQMGVHVSNGTDCPVESPNPMRGLQCAVTRQPLDGSLPPYRPEECMTVEEALQTYTAEGAYASFEESFKGQIAPGMAADFVILDGDPFSVQPSEIKDILVLETYLGGRCVYRA